MRDRSATWAAAAAFLLAAACGTHETTTNPGSGPSVTITTPAGGDTLSGVAFTVGGSAADPDGLAAIRLRAEGTDLDTVYASPFTFYFPAFLYEDGEITITVEAEDTGGAKGSASVGVRLAPFALRSIGENADDEREPAWSSDGASLAFSSEGSSGNRDIYTISTAGGTAAQVTTSTNDDVQPDWFGSTIAFASNRSGNWDIWTIPSSGGAAVQVTTNGSADRGPAWSPSGTTLAFHSKRDGNWNIYGVAVSDGAAAGEPEAYTAAASAESSATWRAGGDVLAFPSTQLGGSDIFTVEPPDPILTAAPGANDPSLVEVDPDLCRKGPYLLYAKRMSGGNYDIWAADIASGRMRQLTTHAAPDRTPVWSPNGKKIAFASNRNGTWDLWIIE